MDMLSSLNSKSDDMKGDAKILSESFATLQYCIFIRQENQDLKAQNEKLEKEIKEMERKMDDFKCRSERDNLIIYGLHRAEKKTGEDCEAALKDLITDKLELAHDIQFHRVHRLNAKPNSAVALCIFFSKQGNDTDGQT